MIDQIEIVSASIISFSLLILAIGVVWSPFAALICARVASTTGEPVGRIAKTGALQSVLFFFPWVYFLLRILGKLTPDRVVAGAHSVIYLACLLGPIMFNLLLAWEIYDLHSNYPYSDGYAAPIIGPDSFLTGAVFGWPQIFSSGAFFTFESMVFWIAALLASATVFFYLWVRSLKELCRMYFAAQNRVNQTASDGSRLPSAQYMAPFKAASGILGLWLFTLVTLVSIGIAVFNDCTLNCTT